MLKTKYKPTIMHKITIWSDVLQVPQNIGAILAMGALQHFFFDWCDLATFCHISA